MPFAAGVKFAPDDFPRYFHPGDLGLKVDDFCLARDPEIDAERIGFISILEGRAPIQMGHLPRIARPATESEVEGWYDLKAREREALRFVRERAVEHGLDIKVSAVYFLNDGRQVLVNFTSEKRIDFRELVKDLAAKFKARIEMWQIGARKEAGLAGGYGVCGQKLCCSNWLKEFPSISMRHAKEQDILQPPSKLAGPCGKLRCCLRYEHEQYVALSAGAPAFGCSGGCSGGGCGVAIDRHLLKGEVTVKKDDGSIAVMPFADFTPDPNQRPPREPAFRGRPGRQAEDEDEGDSKIAPDDDAPPPPAGGRGRRTRR